jgi:hypothetical protein
MLYHSLYEFNKEWVRVQNGTFILRMVLNSYEPRVVFDFDNFD